MTAPASREGEVSRDRLGVGILLLKVEAGTVLTGEPITGAFVGILDAAAGTGVVGILDLGVRNGVETVVAVVDEVEPIIEDRLVFVGVALGVKSEEPEIAVATAPTFGLNLADPVPDFVDEGDSGGAVDLAAVSRVGAFFGLGGAVRW